MFFKPQPVHFVGIGGIGMSGLAELLLELGYRVSGSDLKLSPATDRLAGRGELLAELMRQKYGIAVAGSHGKTTTTSMVAAVLSHAGFDPTIVVGGRVGMMGGANARLGKSDYLVVESDESDGSFLKLAPIVAIVTNIDREHLDHYSGLGEIRRAFAEFVSKVPFYGVAILCLDDENVQQILPAVNRRTLTYGTTAQADLRITSSNAQNLGSEFKLELR